MVVMMIVLVLFWGLFYHDDFQVIKPSQAKTSVEPLTFTARLDNYPPMQCENAEMMDKFRQTLALVVMRFLGCMLWCGVVCICSCSLRRPLSWRPKALTPTSTSVIVLLPDLTWGHMKKVE